MPRKKAINKPKGVVAFDVLNLVTQRDYLEEKDISKLTYDYIPFGHKSSNDFPQHLADLRRKSSTHRAILAQKTVFTTGAGFLCEDKKTSDYLESVNANDEHFMVVWKNLVDDYYTFGNAYLEIVHYQGGVALYHIDATKVRISKDKENIIIHNEWDKYIQRKEEAKVLPFYPNFINTEGGKRSAIQIKDYEPEFTFYGLPDYVASLESISVDYEIGRWNNTKFKNHFQPSSIVEINGDMSDEEAENLVQEARTKFTGESNNGKILFLVKNGDSSPATVTNIQDNSDGNFMELQSVTNQNIITAHRWQPALSGIVSAGKLNNTGSEIRIAYEMVMSTVVKGVAETIMNPIKKILQDNNYNCDTLEVKYKPPISFMSDIDITTVLEINELREVLGYEPKDNYDKLSNQKEEEDKEEIAEEVVEQEVEPIEDEQDE